MDKSQTYWEEEMKALPDCPEEELNGLVASFLKKEPEARNKLLNALQKRIYEAAAGYETEKISRMDVFQEGNLALVEFLSDYEGDGAHFLPTAMAAVRAGIQRFVSEEEVSFAAADALKTKLNVIDEITVRIAEETGKAPTAKEIADLLNTDEDEIKYLLGIALNALQEP